MWRRIQWTGCHGDETHGGDRCCVGGYNGQGVMVRRDMEVTEVMEDATNRVTWRIRIHSLPFHYSCTTLYTIHRPKEMTDFFKQILRLSFHTHAGEKYAMSVE